MSHPHFTEAQTDPGKPFTQAMCHRSGGAEIQDHVHPAPKPMLLATAMSQPIPRKHHPRTFGGAAGERPGQVRFPRKVKTEEQQNTRQERGEEVQTDGMHNQNTRAILLIGAEREHGDRVANGAGNEARRCSRDSILCLEAAIAGVGS